MSTEIPTGMPTEDFAAWWDEKAIFAEKKTLAEKAALPNPAATAGLWWSSFGVGFAKALYKAYQDNYYD